MIKRNMKIGNKYHYRNCPNTLIYLGENWSGIGYWHQFAKIESPNDVWNEALTSDLHLIEEIRADES